MRQALLIQDLSDFRVLVDPMLSFLLAPYVANPWVTLEAAFKWIVCEEIIDTYLLWDPDHHNVHPFPQIHGMLKNKFHEAYPGWDFTWFFSSLIKAPQVYNDSAQIRVTVRGRDLFIHYSTTELLSLPFDHP